MDFDWIITGRLLLSAALGALLGAERDLHARPAGTRTGLVIAVGACLFGILSSEGYADAEGTQDPTRIASIVVPGIGFIGAGVLLKGEDKIVGMTTAASIWLAAGVGLAVGAGMPELAVSATLLALVALPLLDPLSRRLTAIGERRMRRQGRTVVHEG